MSSGPFAWGAPPPAPDASLADLWAQVTALLQATEATSNSPDLQKRAGLRESATIPRRRHELTDPADRLKKLGLETGFDTRVNRFLAAPLEPWTGPPGSMELYARIMRGQASSIMADYGGTDLISLEYLFDEELATGTRDGPDLPMRIVALSDARAPEGRKYEGAPVPDAQAGIGRQLRGHLVALVMAALVNLCSGRTVRRRRRKRGGLLELADGTQVTGAQVTAEANAIKARTPALAGYRWAGTSRVRQVIRDLVGLGIVEEIRSPKAVRERRSWRTLPRIIRRPSADRIEAMAPG